MNRKLIFCVFALKVVVITIGMAANQAWGLEKKYEVNPALSGTPAETKILLVLDSASVVVMGAGGSNNEIRIKVTEANSGSGSSLGSSVFGSEQGALDWSEKDGLIKISQPIYKNDAKKSAKKSQIKVEISGAALPIEIHVGEGSIFIQNWSRDIFAHINKGKILAKENIGALTVHGLKGEVVITKHSGRISVDNVQASTTIKESRGDLDFQSFQGDLLVEKNIGVMTLNINSGNAKVLGGQGGINFENQKGSISVQNFDGRVEGAAGEASVSVSANKEIEAVVKTNQGKVSITTPPNSGAFINVSSVEGDVVLPSYLRPNRIGAGKSFKGRLKGEPPHGNVIVKSQSGTVVIK